MCRSTPPPGPKRTTIPVRRASCELGRLLVAELQAHGHGRRPAGPARHRFSNNPRHGQRVRPGRSRFCAHLDTSPETTGKGVKPQVIRSYAGGDIVLPGDPQPGDPRGRQPGTGRHPRPHADHQRRHDAAGGRRQGGRGHHHGNGRLADGASARFPMARCGSASPATRRSATAWITSIRGRSGPTVCYTLDGQGSDLIDVETFSADLAEVTIRGVNIHPSIAKGRMTNAVRAAGRFPRPVAAATPLARNHRRPPGFSASLRNQRRGGRSEAADPACAISTPRTWPSWPAVAPAGGRGDGRREFPAAQIDVAIEPQYRNMAEGLAPRAAGGGLRPAGPGAAGPHGRS